MTLECRLRLTTKAPTRDKHSWRGALVVSTRKRGIEMLQSHNPHITRLYNRTETELAKRPPHEARIFLLNLLRHWEEREERFWIWARSDSTSPHPYGGAISALDISTICCDLARRANDFNSTPPNAATKQFLNELAASRRN
jgi:hypothetical protein